MLLYDKNVARGLVPIDCKSYCQATGTGTWDLGLGTWDLGPGTWDLGIE